MFDINTAIKSWRRPFELRSWYGDDQIQELETHLVERYEDALHDGVPPEQAFDRAIEQIGSEPILRNDYLTEWKTISVGKRLKRRFFAEARGFDTKLKRVVYNVLRVASILVGLMAIRTLYLVFFVAKGGFDFWIEGVSIFRQGQWFIVALVFLMFFNLVPFTNDEPKWVVTLRKSYIFILLGMTALWFYPMLEARLPFQRLLIESFEFWLMAIGPSLWCIQRSRFAAMNQSALFEQKAAV